MDYVTPVIEFAADTFAKLVALLRNFEVAPGVNIWTIMIVLLIISVTISLFVRTGKA